MVLAYENEDVLDGEATMQGKQAKIVSPTQERAIHCCKGRTLKPQAMQAYITLFMLHYNLTRDNII